jgi:hypothetical protein
LDLDVHCNLFKPLLDETLAAIPDQVLLLRYRKLVDDKTDELFLFLVNDSLPGVGLVTVNASFNRRNMHFFLVPRQKTAWLGNVVTHIDSEYGVRSYLRQEEQIYLRSQFVFTVLPPTTSEVKL